MCFSEPDYNIRVGKQIREVCRSYDHLNAKMDGC
jgi:hypothetical protein